MESGSTIKHYTSRDDYIQKRGIQTLTGPAKSAASKVNASSEAAHKVELSEKIENKTKSGLETIKDDVKEVGKASGHLLADAALSVVKALPKPPVSGLPGIGARGKKALTGIEVKELAPINRPGLFFLSGLELGSISSSDGGLPDLADAVVGGKHYSWKDEDDIFESILRRPKELPIVLVGHSLGGDAVVNLANRLNSLEGGFRRVDLLVTLDSVGFDNDVIPQNVKKNLNFIVDDDFFFNDGPNIARNTKKTVVTNFLRPENHTAIDESSEVHFEIISKIDGIMSQFKLQKKYQKLNALFEDFISSTEKK